MALFGRHLGPRAVRGKGQEGDARVSAASSGAQESWAKLDCWREKRNKVKTSSTNKYGGTAVALASAVPRRSSVLRPVCILRVIRSRLGPSSGRRNYLASVSLTVEVASSSFLTCIDIVRGHHESFLLRAKRRQHCDSSSLRFRSFFNCLTPHCL